MFLSTRRELVDSLYEGWVRTMVAIHALHFTFSYITRRELVDSGYEGWVHAVMAAVEAAGATDAKHGTRLRLENYAFLQLGLQVGDRRTVGCREKLPLK